MSLEIKKSSYAFGVELSKDFMKLRAPGRVSVIMGSRSDWPFMMSCTNMLDQLEIMFEFGVVSAHRTSKRMIDYAQSAEGRGFNLIIACAGGSAHLPGMVASETLLPVLAVAPKKTDRAAIGSMIEMPEGIPLAYLGGGSEHYRSAGAANAALMAARMLAPYDDNLRKRLWQYQADLTASVPHTCHD